MNIIFAESLGAAITLEDTWPIIMVVFFVLSMVAALPVYVLARVAKRRNAEKDVKDFISPRLVFLMVFIFFYSLSSSLLFLSEQS